ncbi:hypothetical protein ABY42_11290 [Haloferax gibbonsii]|uniref:Uncharacterized protein n=1 Tax=Haloferax gibbonsii TaxID=35746 RepID=A0A0K1IVE9_HALGI|nr:hypothetical protein ABY42_11290 [Haloferax gibbonsii]
MSRFRGKNKLSDFVVSVVVVALPASFLNEFDQIATQADTLFAGFLLPLAFVLAVTVDIDAGHSLA